jgi:nicotinate dehydrogenase subunit A
VTILLVNGAAHEVDCDPGTPLLYVLRNDLGLLAAKFGCGLGLCGACTVHVDGHPTHACDTPLWAVEGRPITTLEGLGGSHPLQEAFTAHQALQCGYCTSGMVLAAASLLAENPSPTEGQIRHALEGNICRCTGYQNIVDAIGAVAR